MPSSIEMLPPPFEWIEIPAGKVTIQGHGEFNIPKFSIAKYPITVAQYQVFMNNKGYDTEKYWTTAGWAWKQEEDVTQPRFWDEKHHEKFFKSDHPIIEVSWYEAVAFCRWLSDMTGENIFLPTEQQWQRAAQGDTRWAYPWGNEFDDQRCNSSIKSKSDGTTPVTQYPNGASPYGVMDMAGNIWEWTLTVYASDLNNIDRRVLRGGSWLYYNLEFLRVDNREKCIPHGWSDVIGFRIVLAA